MVEDQLDHEMICAATELRYAQMIKTGVTPFLDITEAPHSIPGVLMAQAEVLRRCDAHALLRKHL